MEIVLARLLATETGGRPFAERVGVLETTAARLRTDLNAVVRRLREVVKQRAATGDLPPAVTLEDPRADE